MSGNAPAIVDKLWNYCDVLRDDGVSYGDYVEQLTYLLFLKMTDEQKELPAKVLDTPEIPEQYNWQSLVSKDGDELETHYRKLLIELGKQEGALGVIFRKAQNRIQDPAKLKRLISYIDEETWIGLDIDVKGEKAFLREETFHGVDLVDSVVRLCVMNLYLHGIGSGESLIEQGDSLLSDPGDRYDMVMTNPPFGKKSSITITTGDGNVKKDSLTYERDDFWATTSNKQLNFLQHVKTLLKIHGKAAIVVPDNVLFEGGAGETVRRRLLHDFDVHTLLRLPTGIFYSQGVKANVLFFDKRPASEDPWTTKLWIYDLRTNKHFTLKRNPLTYEDLQDFITCYNPGNRHQREETERFQSFTYEELMERDKISLDIFWLKDESLEETENLPEPDVLAADIVENLESALEQFRGIYEELEE